MSRADTAALELGLAAAGTTGGDPVRARRYAHPLLGERPMIRLTGDATALAEDELMALSGFTVAETGEPVAAMAPRAAGYPAWALIHRPETSAAALAVLSDMDKAARMVGRNPGPALDKYHDIAERVPADHHPAFWEQVGRELLAVERVKQAALSFGRARAAEIAHDLAVDPGRRAEVYREFALAGALSAKDIKTYVAALLAQDDASAAFEELYELAVRRTLGGQPPWNELPRQISELARAAGLDDIEARARLLTDVSASVVLWRAAAGFWKPQRASVLAALRGSPEFRDRAVRQLALGTADMDAWWIDVLTEADAFATLGADTANWLSRLLSRYTNADNKNKEPVTASNAVLDLITVLAPQLREAAIPVRFGDGLPNEHFVDAAPLSRCLAAEVPVTVRPWLRLSAWRDSHRCDLAALVADPQAADALFRTMQRDVDNFHEFDKLWQQAGLRPLLRRGAESLTADCHTGGFAEAFAPLRILHQLVGPAMAADVAGLRESIMSVDLAEPLARTLRSGVLDELGWAALDAVEGEVDCSYDTRSRPSWPVLVVHDHHKAIVVGPHGRLFDHKLGKPKHGEVLALYSNGELLVGHYQYDNVPLSWQGRDDPGTTVPPETWWAYAAGDRHKTGYTLLAASGARITGARQLSPPDVRLVADRHTFFDGHRYWQQAPTGPDRGLKALDPESGVLSDAEPPTFLDPALLAPDESWLSHRCSLVPLPDGVTDSPLGVRDGLLGFRVSRDSYDSHRYTRIDGVRGEYHGQGQPWGLLDLPGGARVLLVTVGDDIVGCDPRDGSWLWRVDRLEHGAYPRRDDDMGHGTPWIPPPAFWHFLTPRDLEGSAALREITADTVRDLLRHNNPDKAVATVLPRVTHPRLRRGIAGLLRIGREHVKLHDAIVERIRHGVPPCIGVDDAALDEATSGFLDRIHDAPDNTVYQIETAAAFFAGRLSAPVTQVQWWQHGAGRAWPELLGRVGALGVRATSAVTSTEVRETLRLLLRFWADSPLVASGLRRGVQVHGSPTARITETGGFLPLHLYMSNQERWNVRYWKGNPHAFLQLGDFDVPGRSTSEEVPAGWATPDRLRALLSELNERGPVPFAPAGAKRLAELADITPAAASLLLAGLPHQDKDGPRNFLPPGIRKTLRLGVAEAYDGRMFWQLRLSHHQRLALYDAAMPDDPARLWDGEVMIERLAMSWRKIRDSAG